MRFVFQSECFSSERGGTIHGLAHWLTSVHMTTALYLFLGGLWESKGMVLLRRREGLGVGGHGHCL